MELLHTGDQDRFRDASSFQKGENLDKVFRIKGFVTAKDFEVDAAPVATPADVAAAFDEGARCLASKCWNASSTMFRLALDMATRPLLPPDGSAGGPNGKQRRDLGLRLPWLIEAGILPASLARLAHAVREDGNDGAHVGNLGENDAIDLKEFTVLLLERLSQSRRS